MKLLTSVAFATAMMGTGAFAQDICGGIGAGGQWIGGAEDTSDISTSELYMEQMALVMGGSQYVALFNVSADGDVRIEAQGRGAGDPILDVYDSTGQLMISDDDSGGDGASRAETYLTAGTYCATMRAFDNTPMTGFLRVSRLEQEALTPGMTDDYYEGGSGEICDSSTPATVINFGESASGSLDEVPFWRFTLTEPKAIVIKAENETADPYITLYDNDGVYLSENDDWDGLNSRIEMTAPLQPGDYCIAMSAINDSTQPITVSISEYDAAAAALEMYDRGDAAPPLDGSYPVTNLGELATRLRQDVQNGAKVSWFSFDINEPGLVLIEGIGTNGGDPFMVLYDDLGRQIAYNDDAENGYDSMITARVNSGTYLLGIGEVGSGMQSLARMSLERYVPAR